MKGIKLKARAKINLILDVLSKRPDGYHDVEMIMQTIGLHDEIFIKETESFIRIYSNCNVIPLNETNIAFKAAKLIMKYVKIKRGIDIFLHKNIPVAAGLGGGSADAAAVLIGLNKLWNLELSVDNLAKIALSLGADVPFFTLGGTAIACGIGERLTPINTLENVIILLVKPVFAVSTVQVYSILDQAQITQRPNLPQMLDALMCRDLKGVGENLCNVLEQVVCRMHPEILLIKQEMMHNGALGSLMSGSGPTVYGIFDDYIQAESLYKVFKERYPQSFLTYTCKDSIDIIEELK